MDVFRIFEIFDFELYKKIQSYWGFIQKFFSEVNKTENILKSWKLVKISIFNIANLKIFKQKFQINPKILCDYGFRRICLRQNFNFPNFSVAKMKSLTWQVPRWRKPKPKWQKVQRLLVSTHSIDWALASQFRFATFSSHRTGKYCAFCPILLVFRTSTREA